MTSPSLTDIELLQQEVTAAGLAVMVIKYADDYLVVGPTGDLLAPADAGQLGVNAELLLAVIADHQPPPAPEEIPSKNEILSMLLDTVNPDDPDPVIVYLVLRELLTS